MYSFANYNNQEKLWIKLMLSCDFSGKERIVQQLASAEVSRQYTNGYLSLQFLVDKSIPPAEVTKRVPVEMRATKDGENPIVFLLHVLDGYASEVEIFRADLSHIDKNLDVSTAKLEYIT